MSGVHELIPDHWWCDEHREIHFGDILVFGMHHRLHLHPVYARVNMDRRRAAQTEPAQTEPAS